MRSYQIRVGAKSLMAGVLIRRKRPTLTHLEGDGHVKGEAETGVIQLQAEEWWGG